MRPLEEWAAAQTAIRDRPISWLVGHHFHRDPLRGTFADPDLVISPADGTVIYTVTAEPDEPVVDVKGTSYTPRRIIDDPDLNQPVIVIGIFLSLLDVHVQRCPYAASIEFRECEPLATTNQTMIAAETEILTHRRVPHQLDYLARNQRSVADCHTTRFDYHVVLVADDDIDRIVPFAQSEEWFAQGARMSQIRFGSQVELVLPVSAVDQILVAPGWHVEAGVDPIARLTQ